MIQILFWCSFGLIAGAYIGFPLLVVARGMLMRQSYWVGDIEPPVSVVIAAHNEADSIGAKLENVLSLDYPADRLEVLVASDGSTDETESIVRSVGDPRVRLLALPRRGKAAALNLAVAASSGEILIFSDANSMFASNAIRRLVAPFDDERVGGVAGDQRYLKSPDGEGERAYWSLDRLMKRFQSEAGNVISATGAIYAIRRELFQDVPEGVTDDFVTSTRVIRQGYRLVFAEDAVAYEPVAKSTNVEFGRKVRVMTRGLMSVLVMRDLLSPFRFGFYSLQLFAHKVLRRLMVFPLIVLLATSCFLWPHGSIYQLAVVCQLLLYGCAVLGLLLARTRVGRAKPLAFPFYFCMVNIAAFVATVKVLSGQRVVLWEPQRTDTSAVSSSGDHPALGN